MRILIISEIASQHGGDVELAKKYIDESKRAGADIAKLQYYFAEEIMPKDDPRFEQVKRAQLSLEQLSELWDHCESAGIGFLVTPFFRVERVEELASLGVRKCKIREADSQNEAMVKRALELFDEVLISTTRLPVGNMFLYYHPHIKWLLTIIHYPSKLEELELDRIASFDGYSNHIPDIAAPLATAVVAKEHGKEEFIIECHVTLSHAEDNLDKAVSIDFRELAELVKHLRAIERIK